MIYDYMRLLWARIGVPYFAGHRTADREPDRVARWSTAYWRCPRARASSCWRRSCAGRKGEYKKELADFLRKGYQRVKIDGAFY